MKHKNLGGDNINSFKFYECLKISFKNTGAQKGNYRNVTKWAERWP